MSTSTDPTLASTTDPATGPTNNTTTDPAIDPATGRTGPTTGATGPTTAVVPRTHRVFRLRERPAGATGRPVLDLADEEIPALADGQALVRTLMLSVDPHNRVAMSEMRSDQPPLALGAVTQSPGIGRVVASRRDDLPVGTPVFGLMGWQDYQLADDQTPELPFTPLPDPLTASPADLLGVLGLTGITAWLAVELADPRPGRTVVVSAAAGAVGSIAGQLAHQLGARVVGIAGGPDKTRYVVEDLGLDAAVDRHDPAWRDRLAEATPDGIDAIVENAGGALFDHLLTRITPHARIALVGMIADYSGDPEQRHGVRNLVEVLEQRALVQALLVTDHLDRFDAIRSELAARVADGRLVHRSAVLDGLENAPAALDQLFTGGNVGKVLVRVAADEPSPAVG